MTTYADVLYLYGTHDAGNRLKELTEKDNPVGRSLRDQAIQEIIYLEAAENVSDPLHMAAFTSLHKRFKKTRFYYDFLDGDMDRYYTYLTSNIRPTSREIDYVRDKMTKARKLNK